jgi:hypothetical protein
LCLFVVGMMQTKISCVIRFIHFLCWIGSCLIMSSDLLSFGRIEDSTYLSSCWLSFSADLHQSSGTGSKA